MGARWNIKRGATEKDHFPVGFYLNGKKDANQTYLPRLAKILIQDFGRLTGIPLTARSDWTV
jgi:hypothetical protein